MSRGGPGAGGRVSTDLTNRVRGLRAELDGKYKLTIHRSLDIFRRFRACTEYEVLSLYDGRALELHSRTRIKVPQGIYREAKWLFGGY